MNNINDFLEQKPNEIITQINNVLKTYPLLELKIRYKELKVDAFFDNIRPYEIQDDEELHGIFEAGWNYLELIKTVGKDYWKDYDEFKMDKMINDLMEKSIRNKMIKEKWENGTTQ